MVAIRTSTADDVDGLKGCRWLALGCRRGLNSADFPFPWRITVAANASTDETLATARRLADELPGVGVVHLDRKGRGLALRTVWGASDADIVVYMDSRTASGPPMPSADSRRPAPRC